MQELNSAKELLFLFDIIQGTLVDIRHLNTPILSYTNTLETFKNKI